ncbi:MAG: hypothetical protein ACJ8HI_22055 [Massilia sp.]
MRVASSLLSLSLMFALALPASAADWQLRFDGIGPVHVGMDFAHANAALGGVLRATPVALRPTASCDQLPVADHPGVALMFVDDVLERVDVFQPGVANGAGITVGAPLAAVTAAYPDLGREANAYDEREQYLTVLDKGGALAMRFETRTGAVALMTAGQIKAVRYIEGCL